MYLHNTWYVAGFVDEIDVVDCCRGRCWTRHSSFSAAPKAPWLRSPIVARIVHALSRDDSAMVAAPSNAHTMGCDSIAPAPA